MELQTGHLEDRPRANFFIITYYELFSMAAGLNIKWTKAVINGRKVNEKH